MEEFKFEGSVPDFYDRLFGEQMFEPYARDLISRLPDPNVIHRVLELGCGTGRCTKQIISKLRGPLELFSTDISEEMLHFAEKSVMDTRKATKASINWQIVDECDLPYEESFFDLVVCQFGFMFGSDKRRAFAESMRVLKPGGTLLFNVWDDIEKNPLCNIADQVIKSIHPEDHDDFFRLPYSMHDRSAVNEVLMEVGLKCITVMDEPMKCCWNTPREAAEAIIDGSPISNILKGRGEDINPTIDNIAAAYLRHKEIQCTNEMKLNECTKCEKDDTMCFTMNAVIFMCFKAS